MTENTPAITEEYTMKEFGWSKSRFETIQRMYFKNCTYDDIAVFGHVCKHVGLDPFLKQIYPVVRMVKDKNDGDKKKPVMSIQTGIDGYRAIAERTGKYSPGREPSFMYDKDNRLFSATAYVKKMTNDGTWHEVAATAIMREYLPTYTNDFWSTKPHIMISKCAEALALRKAFPAELSGIYTKEEMDQAGKEAELETIVIDPNMDQQKPATNMKHNPETLKTITMDAPHHTFNNIVDANKMVDDVPKISPEELNVFLTHYVDTTDTFKENFEKGMFTNWAIKDFKDIPSDKVPLVMSWIAKNIEMQSMPKGN